MSTVRPITPFRPAKRIVLGEIEGGASYTNYRPQGSGDVLCILTVEGRGLVRAGAERSLQAVGKGDLVIYERGGYQDYGTDPAEGTWRLLYSHAQPTVAHQRQIEKLRRSDGLLRARLGEQGLEASQRAFREGFAARGLPAPLSYDLMENALERVLIWATAPGGDTRSARMDRRIEKALTIMQLEMAGRLTLEGLARRCGLSRARFAELFKRDTGMTPQQAWEMERMRSARSLLSYTSLSVSEIARQVGYGDPFYFSTRFSKREGCSPSAYRKRMR